MFTVTVPGEPCAQGRPRAVLVQGKVRVYDPKTSRSWKAMARSLIQEARGKKRNELAFPGGAVAVTILALHTCPKTQRRKRTSTPRHWRDKRPDIENVVKAILDAATGLLWRDDSQVACLRVDQMTAGQDETPKVVLTVEAL